MIKEALIKVTQPRRPAGLMEILVLEVLVGEPIAKRMEARCGRGKFDGQPGVSRRVRHAVEEHGGDDEYKYGDGAPYVGFPPPKPQRHVWDCHLACPVDSSLSWLVGCLSGILDVGRSLS